ncbi:hypothetical protein F4703DRAFT_1916511 [Phycomyces blakesleeanus]
MAKNRLIVTCTFIIKFAFTRNLEVDSRYKKEKLQIQSELKKAFQGFVKKFCHEQQAHLLLIMKRCRMDNISRRLRQALIYTFNIAYREELQYFRICIDHKKMQYSAQCFKFRVVCQFIERARENRHHPAIEHTIFLELTDYNQLISVQFTLTYNQSKHRMAKYIAHPAMRFACIDLFCDLELRIEMSDTLE